MREGTLDLLGSFMLSRPEFVPPYYKVIVSRLTDPGVSVRKRVIKVIRDVCVSREAAGLYHSAAALETSAYGVAGVPAEAQPALLAALRARRIGADCAGELEPRALAVTHGLAAGRG